MSVYFGEGNKVGTIGDVMTFKGEKAEHFMHRAINEHDGVVHINGNTFEYVGLEP